MTIYLKNHPPSKALMDKLLNYIQDGDLIISNEGYLYVTKPDHKYAIDYNLRHLDNLGFGMGTIHKGIITVRDADQPNSSNIFIDEGQELMGMKGPIIDWQDELKKHLKAFDPNKL